MEYLSLLILILLGMPFHAVLVFTLCYDFLIKFILNRKLCSAIFSQFSGTKLLQRSDSRMIFLLKSKLSFQRRIGRDSNNIEIL